ncbi:unnamed protein product [Hymenolepis diminuta]|uniref:Uncharacterized protein n=1 Tax=Hymenolepis diminuta TaxID=6216 RepID=A0A564Y9Z7_HYMDI|nr:unnamed protein product [Hymenolepis diminuta]
MSINTWRLEVIDLQWWSRCVFVHRYLNRCRVHKYLNGCLSSRQDPVGEI